MISWKISIRMKFTFHNAQAKFLVTVPSVLWPRVLEVVIPDWRMQQKICSGFFCRCGRWCHPRHRKRATTNVVGSNGVDWSEAPFFNFFRPRSYNFGANLICAIARVSNGAESCDRDFGTTCPRAFVNIGRIKGGILRKLFCVWTGAPLAAGAFDFCAATSQCVCKVLVVAISMSCLVGVILWHLVFMFFACGCPSVCRRFVSATEFDFAGHVQTRPQKQGSPWC